MLDHGDKAFVAGIRQGAARVENLCESVCDNRPQARVSDGLSTGLIQKSFVGLPSRLTACVDRGCPTRGRIKRRTTQVSSHAEVAGMSCQPSVGIVPTLSHRQIHLP
jgi:hypothetical protein